MAEQPSTGIVSGVPLPARYDCQWRAPFEQLILNRLEPGSSVLDIGSGRRPTIETRRRPSGVRYVGLDLSAHELDAAGPGAYDETVAADVARLCPELVDQFDQVISWQVLEHVRDLTAAVEHIRLYLKPGGQFVALFSGSWSAFGVVNRVLPNWIGSRLVEAIMKRKEMNAPVFPAYYDKCYARALATAFERWREKEIVPLYRGAGYFRFSPTIERVYLAYENFIFERNMANLATHYLVLAHR